MSPRFIQAIIELNLTAPIVAAQAANRVMQAQPEGGCIINISSQASMTGGPESLRCLKDHTTAHEPPAVTHYGIVRYDLACGSLEQNLGRACPSGRRDTGQ